MYFLTFYNLHPKYKSIEDLLKNMAYSKFKNL